MIYQYQVIGNVDQPQLMATLNNLGREGYRVVGSWVETVGTNRVSKPCFVLERAVDA